MKCPVCNKDMDKVDVANAYHDWVASVIIDHVWIKEGWDCLNCGIIILQRRGSIWKRKL